MDYIARGLYRELLDECWAEGFIPSDPAKLAEICDCPKQMLEKCWQLLSICFEEVSPGILVNKRMHEERTEQDSKRAKLAISGKLGGIAKLQAENIGKQLPETAKQLPETPKQMPYSSSKAVAEHEHDSTQDGSEQFENSMSLYPSEKRDYSNLTQNQYFKAIGEIRQVRNCSSSEAVVRLDKHIKAYVASKGEFCVGFLKYLDSKPWKTAPAPPAKDPAAVEAAKEARLAESLRIAKAQKETLRAQVKANQA